MDRCALGATGLKVSRLGLGLAALGRPGYINLGHAADLGQDYDVAAMQAHAWEVLDRAWEAGVCYFDAARSYGRAEAFLAGWLQARQIKPDDVVIGSKWGYTYTAGWQIQADRHEVKDHSSATLSRQWAESQTLLGPHLQLYQIHSATLESGVLDDDAVLESLARVRETGVRIGLSATGPRQAEIIARAVAIRVGGNRLFDTVQATWNLLERSAGPALAAAHDAGVGVIIKEALANGRLTERNLEPAFAATRQLLEDLAADRGTTIDALALAAVLAQPWADVVLSGAATVAQLDSNVAALTVAWNGELDRELASLSQGTVDYWKQRTHLAWN